MRDIASPSVVVPAWNAFLSALSKSKADCDVQKARGFDDKSFSFLRVWGLPLAGADVAWS
jgi:hypothetical protein